MNFKKIIIYLTVLSLIVSFIACNNNPIPDDTPPTTSEQIENPTDDPANDKLVVYTDMVHYFGVGKTETFLSSLKTAMEARHNLNIEIEYYDPTGGDSTMDFTLAMQRMNLEIMAGRGPDLIIANAGLSDFYEVNLQKQMAAGAFAPLTDYLGQTADNYQPALLEACSINETLYVLPIDYTINAQVTTQDDAAVADIDFDAMDTFNGFIDEATRYMQGDAPRSLLGYSYEDTRSYLLNGLLKGVYPTPQDLKKALDSDAFAKIVELTKLDYEKNRGIYAPEEQNWIEDPPFGMYLTNHSTLMDKARSEGKVMITFGRTLDHTSFLELFVQNSLEGTCKVLPIPNVQGGNTVTIATYAAIRASSNKRDAAWAFMQIYTERYFALGTINAFPAADFDLESFLATPWYHASNKYRDEKLPQSMLDKLNPGGTAVPSTPEQEEDAPVYPVDEWYDTVYKYIEDFQNNITGVTLSGCGHEMVGAAFEDYIKGNATYEQCLANAKFQLELYLTE